MEFNLTEKQSIAHEYLTDDQDRSVLFGGAKGGGKSFYLCFWVMAWVSYLIDYFGLEATPHPPALGFMGRRQAVDFNKTTLETFKKVVPYSFYEIRSQDKEIIFGQKADKCFEGFAKVLFGGLDDRNAVEKFNSAEYAFIAIDQAEETERMDVSVLQASLRLRLNNKTPPYKELYTANPREGWLKEDFVLGNRVNTRFIPALPDDNPHLPNKYKNTLRESFGYDEKLLAAYLEGDWDAFSAVDDAVFQPNWFTTCRKNVIETDLDFDQRVIAVDVATKHGKCATVICYRIGDKVISLDEYYQIPSTQTANIVAKMYHDRKAHNVVIDSDGFGEGVSDILEGMNVPLMEFHGGTSATAQDDRRFSNLRTEFYCRTAKKVEKGILDLSMIDQKTYEALKGQSCQVKYRVQDAKGRYRIETKDDMRARQVKSPDLTDALVYSEYAIYMAKYADVQPMSFTVG